MGTSAVRAVGAVILAVGLAVATTGCTGPREYIHNGFKVGPNYRRPPTPVAEHWIDADDQRVRSEPFDDSQWWTVFNDPVLESLIQAAYRQNLTLREVGYRVLAARARRAIACGNLLPQTQQAFADYDRKAISLNVPNRDFLGLRMFDNFQTGFNLSWELDFWGRFRRALEAADADLDASIEKYDDVLVVLLGEVATDYVNLRILQEQIRLTRENVQLQRGTLHLVTERFKGGAVSLLDVEQAKARLAQTESLVPALEIQLRNTTNNLCVLLGLPPEDLQHKLAPTPFPTAPPDVVVGIPAELLRRRPDVRRAERLAATECARIGVAESNLYPAFSIIGVIGVDAASFSHLFEPQSFFGSIGPSIRWNFLNYGRLLNAVREQEARFMEIAAAYQNIVLKAHQEVENGLIQFLRGQEQAAYLKQAVDAAAKSTELALIQYKEGKVDYNRVFLIQGDLVDRQIAWMQARGNVALGLIQVYRALGGGWQIRCAPLAGPGAGSQLLPTPTGEVLPMPAPANAPEHLPAAANPPAMPPATAAPVPAGQKEG
jgi:NodT family efflux transporter outer membrane factor (OMF) lipoprotein